MNPPQLAKKVSAINAADLTKSLVQLAARGGSGRGRIKNKTQRVRRIALQLKIKLVGVMLREKQAKPVREATAQNEALAQKSDHGENARMVAMKEKESRTALGSSRAKRLGRPSRNAGDGRYCDLPGQNALRKRIKCKR